MDTFTKDTFKNDHFKCLEPSIPDSKVVHAQLSTVLLLENDLETQITNCPTRTVDLSSSSKIQNDLNYIFQLQREFFTFFNCPQISSIFLLFSQVKLQFLNLKDILV